MALKQEVNNPVIGMNRGSNIAGLKAHEYSFAINVNFSNESGDENVLKLEGSNLLATEFKPGYKVVGMGNDITTKATYFLLTNPTTGLSEFGRIKDNQTIPYLGDTDVLECSSCNKHIKLSEPLEKQAQVAIQVYETLLSDCIDNKCFGLSIHHPIKKIIIKNEKCGNVAYFTDNNQVPRFIQLDNLDIYSYTGDIECGEDNRVETCLDCEKMRMFKRFKVPNIIPAEIIVGGDLKKGTYEALIAYVDVLGNELSEYYSLTSPISIFDINDTTKDSEDTNFAIKFFIEGLDKKYRNYKVVIIQTTGQEGNVRYFEEGIHTTSDTDVIYASDKGKKEISINDIFFTRPTVEKWEGMATANKYLFGYGETVQKEVNLQPVFNLMGSFLRWQTHIAKEDLYESGINTSLYTGYRRDEVQPYGIRLFSDNGSRTSIFNLPSRPATISDREVVSNDDRSSIEANISDCNTTDRTQKWQFYNTATELGFCSFEDIPTNTVTEDFEKTCVVEEVASTPPGNFIIDIDFFIGIVNTIDNIVEEGSCNPDVYDFCAYLDPDLYPSCTPLYEDCDAPTLLESTMQVNRVVWNGNPDDQIEEIERVFADEYRRTQPPSYCNVYYRNEQGELIDDPDMDAGIIKRNEDYYNTNCSYREPIIHSGSTPNATMAYYHRPYGSTDSSEIFSDYSSYDTGAYFFPFVNKNALWFSIDIREKSRFIFELTKVKKADGDLSGGIDPTWGPRQMRVTFYNDCNNKTAIFSKIVDADQGEMILIEREISTLSMKFTASDGTTKTSPVSGTTIIAVVESATRKNSGEEFYLMFGLNGCWSVVTRDIEIKQYNIKYDSIVFDKYQKYVAECTFDVPILSDCKPLPYKYGKYAFWESQETYPDNAELYDSSVLDIDESDIPIEYRDEFMENFADTISGGKYDLKPDTNLTCKPIRHPKLPDNSIAPFLYSNQQAPFVDNIIFPLGATIDENLINSFLDIAVKNDLITQEYRDSISGYEIYRADNRLDKSIIASGLLYDVRKYKEKDKEILYPNIGHNDLGDDILNYSNESRDTFIPHPYGGNGNKVFTFHSPETEFLRPSIGTELKVEGYQYGWSRMVFDEVEEHPKWVILGAEARRLASRLATLEVIAEAAITAAQSAEVYRIDAGFVFSLNVVGIVLNVIATALNAINSAVFKYGRYKYEWLQTFTNLGQPRNFANYAVSEGKFNFMKTYDEKGDLLRGITVSKYVPDGKFIITDQVRGEKLEINNIDGEKTVLISTGDFMLNYPDEYKRYDNNKIDKNLSSLAISSTIGECSIGRSAESRKKVASPYVTIKNYKSSQFGNIDNIKWLSTSYQGDLKNPKTGCLPIFGGTVFINRHTLKRKTPLFLRNEMGQADKTPFNYKAYSNIGEEVRFYCNYLVSSNMNIDKGMPTIDSEYQFDCIRGNRQFYVEPPSKFYLYWYGIPNFFVETEINTSYRNSGKEPKDNFYPNVGDFVDWTQEKNVSIREPNKYLYNFNYSKGISKDTSYTLPNYYNKEDFDCRYDSPNRVRYSLQDSSENGLDDPWLTFLPLDKFTFSSSNGKLVDITGIENEQLLVRFEDNTEVYNAVDTTVDDGQRPETQNLGSGGIFARRPRTFSETDLGKWGTQSFSMSSNEFGHFSVDAKRGSITQIMPSSQGVKEISKYGSQGQPNGMYNWFREHLPFKILKSNIMNRESINTDNPYNGIGITIGYDDRYKRIFFTKKDYVPKVNGIVHENGTFRHNEQVIELNDSQYFTDASWTIAYDPAKQSWISYYDFKPNYYISHNSYFQTGINSNNEENGLWSHNLTNKSYRVFYGKVYPSIVTYATKNDLKQNRLTTIMFKSDAKRYHNEYDFAYEKGLTWNKANIYSTRENSGNLELIPQTHLAQVNKYPITKTGVEQQILITNTEELWSFDYIFNRVKSEKSNQPHFTKDINDIGKTINPNAISFYGKKVLEPLTSTAFNVQLTFDKDSRYDIDLQWAINQESDN